MNHKLEETILRTAIVSCVLIAMIGVLATCAFGCATSTRVDAPEPEVVNYEVRRSHAGWRVQNYYPDTDFTGHVFMQDADRERHPLHYTGHDLATAHLIFSYAWRDTMAGGDEEVAECLAHSAMYVPSDDESFGELCGNNLSTVGCYFSAESFGLEGLTSYVQVVRWDHYDNLTRPEYQSLVHHEAAHRLAECLFGHPDRAHELTFLWEDVVPLATEYELTWLEGR